MPATWVDKFVLDFALDLKPVIFDLTGRTVKRLNCNTENN